MLRYSQRFRLALWLENWLRVLLLRYWLVFDWSGCLGNCEDRCSKVALKIATAWSRGWEKLFLARLVWHRILRLGVDRSLHSFLDDILLLLTCCHAQVPLFSFNRSHSQFCGNTPLLCHNILHTYQAILFISWAFWALMVLVVLIVKMFWLWWCFFQIWRRRRWWYTRSRWGTSCEGLFASFRSLVTLCRVWFWPLLLWFHTWVNCNSGLEVGALTLDW